MLDHERFDLGVQRILVAGRGLFLVPLLPALHPGDAQLAGHHGAFAFGFAFGGRLPACLMLFVELRLGRAVAELRHLAEIGVDDVAIRLVAVHAVAVLVGVLAAEVQAALIRFAADLVHAAGVRGGVRNDQQDRLALCVVQIMEIRRCAAELDRCLDAILDGDLHEVALHDDAAVARDQVRRHLHVVLDARTQPIDDVVLFLLGQLDPQVRQQFDFGNERGEQVFADRFGGHLEHVFVGHVEILGGDRGG